MRRRYDEGERPDLAQENLDIHTAASLLKLYFRELPQPVIPYEHFESFLSLATSFKYKSNHEETFQNLKSLVRQIPKENYTLLDYLTGFLYEISKHQAINKMTEKNIALIFGTNILRGLDYTPEFQMATQNLTTHIVEALVKWHDLVFTGFAEDEQEPAGLSNQLGETTPEAAVDDLLGIDFTKCTADETTVNPQRTPPPIPARAQHHINDLDSISNDSGLYCSTASIESNQSENVNHANSVPTGVGELGVTRRASSMRTKGRPAAMLQSEITPPNSPTRSKTDTQSLRKIERTASNFTSFIDSPLDQRISLNIGDLPASPTDLQALVLSLKMQLKEQRKTSEKLKLEGQFAEARHQQQMQSLAKTICQERQAKDEAVTRVVSLANQLALYESKFGSLDDQ